MKPCLDSFITAWLSVVRYPALVRQGRIEGYVWEIMDPLFWPNWLRMAVPCCVLTMALCAGLGIWGVDSWDHWQALKLHEASVRKMVYEREQRLREYEPVLARHKEVRSRLMTLQGMFGTPLRPLDLIATRARSFNVEMTHLLPVQGAAKESLSMTLEGSFPALFEFLFSPLSADIWHVSEWMFESLGEHETDKKPFRIRLHVEMGWPYMPISTSDTLSRGVDNGQMHQSGSGQGMSSENH